MPAPMPEGDLRQEQDIQDQAPEPVPEGDLRLLLDDLYQDEIGSYRRREAAWLSLATHGVAILLLLLLPKWLDRGTPVIVPIRQKQDTTFLQLPSDMQKVQAPKSSRISDKDRIAQSRAPVPNKEDLRRLLDARNPGPPKQAPAPPAPVQPPPQPPGEQPQPALQGQVGAQAQQQTSQTAKLEVPLPARPKSPFSISSPGSTVSKAIQSVANTHGITSIPIGGGDYGAGIRPHVATRGDLEILSDTMGVDFGPYLKRLRQAVEEHWYPLIPQSAMPPEMKRGKVLVEFAILKDGRVAGLRILSGSGDIALDRAAYGAITYANPLPQLPEKFGGEFLLLRAHFYYNPDKNELE
ncbi:MAG TPA: TonB family protein [Candidatus Angelobacter sp.]